MPDSETKNARLVAHFRPPIIGLIGCLFVAAAMLFLAYALYHTAGHLGAGPGGMRVPPGEHGLGGALLGLLFVLLISLLPWFVQSLLALIFGLFCAFVFIVGLRARMSKRIVLEISEKGIASYGLFRNNRLGWSELSSVAEAKNFVKLQLLAQNQGEGRSIFIKNVDVSHEEILAAIRQYRPDLVPKKARA